MTASYLSHVVLCSSQGCCDYSIEVRVHLQSEHELISCFLHDCSDCLWNRPGTWLAKGMSRSCPRGPKDMLPQRVAAEESSGSPCRHAIKSQYGKFLHSCRPHLQANTALNCRRIEGTWRKTLSRCRSPIDHSSDLGCDLGCDLGYDARSRQ